jgi:hypothetical protein
VERTLISELPGLIGERVRLRGWVNALRDQKRVQFVVLRDESGMAQVVLAKDDPPSELNERVSALTVESAVTIVGTVAADERVNLGGLELKLEELEVDSPAEPEVPIAPDSALDKRIDWRFLDLRRPDRKLIFEVQTATERAMRDFWAKEGFIELHSPKLTGAATESGAELFQLEYFDRMATLAQSPQFYKQMAMAAGFGKVFEVGPVFRANPSFTSRHDTEFTSVDTEISWIDSHEDVMNFEERWLAHVLAAVKESYGERIARAAVSTDHARRCQGAAARGRARCAAGRARSRPAERARAVGDRQGALRQRVHVRHRLPDVRTALLPHALRRPADRDQELRPAVAGHRADDRRPARAPLRQAARAGRREEGRRRGDQLLPRLLPLRRAAARRLRLRVDAPADADARPGQRARGDVPISRAAPARAVAAAPRGPPPKPHDTLGTRRIAAQIAPSKLIPISRIEGSNTG